MQRTSKQRKQNLICIYEDHDQPFWIHNKIVSLYLNRFVIEEDAEHECLGTYTLQSPEWQRIEGSSEFFLCREFYKRENDKKKITEIINRASQSEEENYVTNIVLGTAFYTAPERLSL